MKTSIIGGGNLGGSFAQQLIIQKYINACDLHIVNRRADRANELQELLGCTVSTELTENVTASSVVVLTVKPQDFSDVASKLKNFINEKQIIISMMTGITLERLSSELPIVTKTSRLMPNLPFSVGEGLSVCAYSKALTETERFIVKRMLSVLGECIDVNDENLIDVATAVSASGPGYFFYLLSHFAKKTQELGFDEKTAKFMVGKTMLGAAKLFLTSSHSAHELQQKVASKGGTTEAALKVFSENKLGEIFELAVEKAFLRAKELSKKG